MTGNKKFHRIGVFLLIGISTFLIAIWPITVLLYKAGVSVDSMGSTLICSTPITLAVATIIALRITKRIMPIRFPNEVTSISKASKDDNELSG